MSVSEEKLGSFLVQLLHLPCKWTETPDNRRPSSLSPIELVAVMRPEPRRSDYQTTMPSAVLHVPTQAGRSGAALCLTHAGPLSLPLAWKVNKHAKNVWHSPGSPSYFLTWLLLGNNLPCYRWGNIYLGWYHLVRPGLHTDRSGNSISLVSPPARA